MTTTPKTLPLKLRKAITAIILDHPLVATTLLKHPITTHPKVKTFGIDQRGQIYYNEEFVASLPVQQIVFGLAHEVFHRMSLHWLRKAGRDKERWNIACDAWINDTLDRAKIGELIPDIVNIPGSADTTAEKIYDTLPEPEPEPEDIHGQGRHPGNSGDGTNPPPPGAGGDPIEDDMVDIGEPMTESQTKELEAQIKIEVAEAMAVAKQQGKLSGALASFCQAVLDVRTPWYDILERYMVNKTRRDSTWTRPNRRYEQYMPSLQSYSAMGELVVQVDVSGSVSPKELQYYSGHLSRIIDLCKPTKVHVLYTDTEVIKHMEFEEGEEFKIEFHKGGGTDMRAGIAYCHAKGLTPEVMITMTDGYTPFPDDEPIPHVWVVSSDKKAPAEAGTTVHFDMYA